MAKTKRERTKSKIKYSQTKKWVEDSSGGFEPTSFELPEGMSRYKWKKGKNRLDFMPYVVTSEHNPEASKGEVHWNRLYKVHNKIGPQEKTYACGQNFGKTCKICIGLAKDWRKSDTDKDLLEAQKAKDRRLFFVKDLDDKEDKGIQVLETGHYKTFGELLRDELDSLSDGDPQLDFFHLSDGMTVEVICKEDTFAGKKYNKPYKITIVERDEQYDDDMLDEIPSLDDVVKETPAKKLEALYNMEEDDSEDEDEDEEDDKPVKKKKKAKDEDDELDLDDEDEEEEKPKKKKPKKKKVEDDDGDEQEEEDDGDEEEDESEEEDDESEDEDDDEDDGEDSDEDGDEEDEDDSDEPSVAVGDRVSFLYKKKLLKGKVTKINKKNGVCLVAVKGQERPSAVDLDDLTLLGSTEEKEKPKKKKEVVKPTKKKKKVEEDDEEELDLDFGDDDDEPFDDEEEDEKPVKKKKKKKK